LNGAVDHAVIKVLSVGSDVKVHDSGKGDDEQDEQKKVKLKTQAPHGGRDFPEKYCLQGIFHLFILTKGTQKTAEVLDA